jgi:actin cytoskeleton-regulatory complex protein PAN1
VNSRLRYVSLLTRSIGRAKALYSYVGENAEELPFTEGDTLSIVDRSDGDWWKAEKDGVVFIVPAAYLELEG